MQDARCKVQVYLVAQLPGLPVGQLILVVNFKYRFAVVR